MTFANDGAEIHRAYIDAEMIDQLRAEAGRLAQSENEVSVRSACIKSPSFHRLATSARIRKLLPSAYSLVRSILFDKTPEKNWPVAWHQDLSIAVEQKIELPNYGPWSIKSGISHVQPPSSVLRQMATLRIHLDDTPSENGALQIIRGSHKRGKLSQTDIDQLVLSSPVETCACKAGDVLMMAPLILHASSRSKMPSHRRILHLEFANQSALHEKLRWHSQS